MGEHKFHEPTRGADSGMAQDPYVARGHGRTDEQIRADVHELLTSEGIVSPQGLAIEVREGIVTIDGTITDERAREELLAGLRCLPSVKRVEDRLRAAAGSA